MEKLIMNIGYARVSTIHQDTSNQVGRLEEVRCERIFKENASAKSTKERLQLNKMLDSLNVGDVVIITKLDRLARSLQDLHRISETIKEQGAELRVLDQEGIDPSTPMGKLMFNMLGAIAEFERSLMLERQKEGIAKAKHEGKYKGRAPTARAKSESILKLKNAGVKPAQIAKDLNIGIASVYRILRDTTPESLIK